MRKLLQGLVRQARKNRLVYLVLAECRLILPEAQAPQPDHNVHDGAHNQWWRASSAGGARVSRVALGFSGPSQSPRRSDGNGRSLTLFCNHSVGSKS